MSKELEVWKRTVTDILVEEIKKALPNAIERANAVKQPLGAFVDAEKRISTLFNAALEEIHRKSD